MALRRPAARRRDVGRARRHRDCRRRAASARRPASRGARVPAAVPEALAVVGAADSGVHRLQALSAGDERRRAGDGRGAHGEHHQCRRQLAAGLRHARPARHGRGRIGLRDAWRAHLSRAVPARRRSCAASGASSSGFHDVPFRLDLPRVWQIARLGVPAALQMLLEVGVFAAASALAGRISPMALAANQIVLNIAGLSLHDSARTELGRRGARRPGGRRWRRAGHARRRMDGARCSPASSPS